MVIWSLSFIMRLFICKHCKLYALTYLALFWFMSHLLVIPIKVPLNCPIFVFGVDDAVKLMSLHCLVSLQCFLSYRGYIF